MFSLRSVKKNNYLQTKQVSTSVAKCAKDVQKTSFEVVINESSLHTVNK